MSFYVVNLSSLEIETNGSGESATRQTAAALLTKLRRRDELTSDGYANRLIVSGLTRDEIETALVTDPYSLFEHSRTAAEDRRRERAARKSGEESGEESVDE